MTYEEFLEANRDALFRYCLIAEASDGRVSIQPPLPRDDLTEEEFEALTDRLDACMPRDSMMMDLWDWDIHFERVLEDDWYFEAALGPECLIPSCADDLADLFLEKVDEYGMDYNQSQGDEDFESRVREEAEKFVSEWRQNIIAKLIRGNGPPAVANESGT